METERNIGVDFSVDNFQNSKCFIIRSERFFVTFEQLMSIPDTVPCSGNTVVIISVQGLVQAQRLVKLDDRFLVFSNIEVVHGERNEVIGGLSSLGIRHRDSS